MSLVRDYMIGTMSSVTLSDSIKKAIIMYRAELSVLPVVDYHNRFVGTIYSNNISKNIIPESFGVLDSSKLFYEVNEELENLKSVKNENLSRYMVSNKNMIKENEEMKKVADIMLNNKESLLFVIK